MMKYEVGDKVEIKTWKRLVQEYGLSVAGSILAPPFFNGTFFAKGMERDLGYIASDRILTIGRITCYCYEMKEIANWDWCDYMIVGLVKNRPTIFDPIESRFNLMDFE